MSKFNFESNKDLDKMTNDLADAKASIVEFSRHFGENADVYKEYEPKDRETGDVGYDCE